MRWLLTILAGSVLLTGCNVVNMVHKNTDQPYVTNDRLERGLVIVLPGIEGRSSLNENICRGLNDGGVNWAIKLYDWTSAWGGFLYNQRAEDRNRAKCHEIIDEIIRYRWSYPNRPVVIVGQSGGAAMAIWTAEAMPSNTKLAGLLLIDASISSDYMLDYALANTERGIVNFYSSRDVLALGLGTTFAGTMDGTHSSPAGRIGFSVPTAGGRPAIYQKLFQIAWQPKMAETGNYGLHLTSGSSRFVTAYVAPFVLEERWNRDFIASVVNNAPGSDQTSSQTAASAEPQQ